MTERKEVSERKAAIAARSRQVKHEGRSRRIQVWACFWTFPLGHRYATHDGRTTKEVFAEETSSGGAQAELKCVGCGREYGLFVRY